jgi:hypothetical protein
MIKLNIDGKALVIFTDNANTDVFDLSGISAHVYSKSLQITVLGVKTLNYVLDRIEIQGADTIEEKIDWVKNILIPETGVSGSGGSSGTGGTGWATETKQIELIGISTEDRDLSIERNSILDEILQRTVVGQKRGVDIETFTIIANPDGDAEIEANDRRKVIIQNVSVTDAVWVALGSAGKNKGFRITPLEKFVLEDYTGSIFFYCEDGNAEVYITEIS